MALKVLKAFALGFVLPLCAVMIMFWIGQGIIGAKREGGIRLVVLMIGSGMSVVSAWLVIDFWPVFLDQKYPEALAVILGGLSLPLGLVLIAVSVAGSNAEVSGALDYLSGGFRKK